jgi:hypothetical protein
MISSSPRAKAQADPFKSFYMHNYYDSSLVDFRTDFQKYLSAQSAESIDFTDTIRSYDLSKVWQSGKFCSSGVLGTDYRRIDIYISSVRRDRHHSNRYILRGKSRVRKTIRSFVGRIQIVRAYRYSAASSEAPPNGASLMALYIFREDSLLAHTGTFDGVLSSDLVLEPLTHTAYLDTSLIVADGYTNNVFVGIWTGHRSLNIKKCIWADGRLPFTFDFDVGDGEMEVNRKYVGNGWQTFNDRTDVVYDDSTKQFIPADPWWR